jgi:hypothetical protein
MALLAGTGKSSDFCIQLNLADLYEMKGKKIM